MCLVMPHHTRKLPLGGGGTGESRKHRDSIEIGSVTARMVGLQFIETAELKTLLISDQYSLILLGCGISSFSVNIFWKIAARILTSTVPHV